MPGMTMQKGGSRVVSSDNKNIRMQSENLGNELI